MTIKSVKINIKKRYTKRQHNQQTFTLASVVAREKCLIQHSKNIKYLLEKD